MASKRRLCPERTSFKRPEALYQIRAVQSLDPGRLRKTGLLFRNLIGFRVVNLSYYFGETILVTIYTIEMQAQFLHNQTAH